MPETRMGTECEQGSQAVRYTGARKPPKRAGETHVEDARAATWFSEAVGAYEKADAYADACGILKNDLSEMRSGKRSVALRRLLPMQDHAPSALAFCEAFLANVKVAEHPDAVLSLVTGLLEEIGMVARPKGGITPAQVGAIATRLLCDGRASREMLERECKRIHGASPDDVALALHKEGETK